MFRMRTVDSLHYPCKTTPYSLSCCAAANYQYPGYVLGDVAAKIEAARYFCWKSAHYLDQHGYHGEMLGAMCKIHCTEMLLDCVYKCMQVVGVNSVDKKTGSTDTCARRRSCRSTTPGTSACSVAGSTA